MEKRRYKFYIFIWGEIFDDLDGKIFCTVWNKINLEIVHIVHDLELSRAPLRAAFSVSRTYFAQVEGDIDLE